MAVIIMGWQTGQLPAGWTLEEIREVSGDQESVALDTDRVVTWVGRPGEDERLHPEIILRFHGLCLVKLRSRSFRQDRRRWPLPRPAEHERR
ncbi:hypothetical protein ASD08_24215 [Streptomyces sp. Root369]|nr:hypothetical protein ASD08_24215 [Streptomyces sp. Root369]